MTTDLAKLEKRVFPLPQTGFYNLIFDPAFRKKFHERLGTSNRFVVPLYKSGLLPLFGISRQIMILRTRGRLSQKWRDFPVGYTLINGVIHLFSSWGKEANWYKNILACPDEVFIQVGLHRQHVRPEIVADPEERRRILQKYVQQHPKDAAGLIGWDPDQDQPETADFSVMIEKVEIVKFILVS